MKKHQFLLNVGYLAAYLEEQVPSIDVMLTADVMTLETLAMHFQRFKNEFHFH
ncbi:MAG: hypothetical protein HYV06_02305 [Deltaproteobacteria bacterium]|nr:hypothetical protein [Deltaproteobacteria bacterium]